MSDQDLSGCPVRGARDEAGPAPTDYAAYLDVESLLERARPRTDVPDEVLFIVTHQALELWFAEALHEIDRVIAQLAEGRLTEARHGMRRLHLVVRLWMSHMDVLDTMPTSEFNAFRGALGRASGLQSSQFRELELASGLRSATVMRIAQAVGSADRRVQARAGAPSLRTAFLEVLERSGTSARALYRSADPTSESWALAEDLVEYDVHVNQWRYRHYLLVLRAIGSAPGTGGSNGAGYLAKTLDSWFFPELWSARSMQETTIGTGPPRVVLLDGPVPADRSLLGGKGWGLREMSERGIPVPPAFTLTTAACLDFYAAGHRLPDDVWAQVLDHLVVLERQTGARFGGSPPLLVSVRSGAPVSMPGMMDTLLNVGLTPDGTEALRQSGAEPALLEELARSQQEACAECGVAVPDAHGEDGRAQALEQLHTSVEVVFRSWHSDRAQVYRLANGIPDDMGTAVTVQAMVFGNRDDRSGTGVYVTRDPVSGDRVPFGEWLPRAQGEDLVSGLRTPQPLEALHDRLPEAYRQLVTFGARLERLRRSVLEIEFTVESGVLHLLQVRDASGSDQAMVHWAVDLVHEGLIDISEALSRIPSSWDPAAPSSGAGHGEPLARGLGVSPGVATGYVVDSADEAADLADEGRPVVLVRPTTSPHDISGFLVAAAVVTERGGSTSHAAVVGRQMGLPCVVGCGAGAVERLRGRLVTVDGTRGVVHEGPAELVPQRTERSAQVESLLRWRSAAAAP